MVRRVVNRYQILCREIHDVFELFVVALVGDGGGWGCVVEGADGAVVCVCGVVEEEGVGGVLWLRLVRYTKASWAAMAYVRSGTYSFVFLLIPSQARGTDAHSEVCEAGSLKSSRAE